MQAILPEYAGKTLEIWGNAAQFGGASGSVFSAVCGMQISRFTSSKPSESAFASDEKSIRRPTASFVRCTPRNRVRFFESVRRKNLPAHSGAAGMDEALITCGGQPQDCEPSLVKSTRNARSDSSVKQKYMIKSHNSVIFRLTKREFAV